MENISIEDHNGAVVDSVKDAGVISAVIRGTARAGHAISRADAAEVLFALYAMKQEDRLRLASKLLTEKPS